MFVWHLYFKKKEAISELTNWLRQKSLYVIEIWLFSTCLIMFFVFHNLNCSERPARQDQSGSGLLLNSTSCPELSVRTVSHSDTFNWCNMRIDSRLQSHNRKKRRFYTIKSCSFSLPKEVVCVCVSLMSISLLVWKGEAKSTGGVSMKPVGRMGHEPRKTTSNVDRCRQRGIVCNVIERIKADCWQRWAILVYVFFNMR